MGLTFIGLLSGIAAFIAFILLLVFVMVPLFKGIGWLIGGVFRSIGWIIAHVFEFVSGMLGDTVRFVGAVIAGLVLVPLALLSVVVGRWSAANHFAKSMKRECSVGFACLYRVVLRRPLKLVLLHGLLEGVEQRVPEAMDAAPGADRPRRRTGQFDGYTIVGSLRGGGSGAKLYIAQPTPQMRAKISNLPDRVVIKSFALTEGSTLPQIVRESRALEAAKQLGLVLHHSMDEHRFFYVMPYHAGEDLGIITRELHGKSGVNGLDQRHLTLVMGYVEDLLTTLSGYHRGGLWHKDVKPENVIIRDGEAHLVDLGLVTPLRSAMTLTTHGTEYFRDPEMVRMALRGVKVHQVDGAKFDIYAVAAVLYFMIENTFPAHGGLSKFTKRSPEALRWIVRRGMADYNKRYETAATMLADLKHMAASSDPYAVKPVDLPSMHGGGEVEPEPEPEVEFVHHAASPAPPAREKQEQEPVIKGFGVAVGPGGAQVGTLNLDKDGASVDAPPAGAKRPRLRVTNWWTGAYETDEAGDRQAFREQARAFRNESRAFRAQADELGRQVRLGAIGARKAAREQIKAARARAREIRSRTRHPRRHRPVADRQPSVGLILLTLLIMIGGTWGIVRLVTPSQRRVQAIVGAWPQAHALAPLAPLGFVPSSIVRDQPLLVINDHPRERDPRVRTYVTGVLEEYSKDGWKVVLDLDNEDAEAEIRKALPLDVFEVDRLSPLLQSVLKRHGLGGILHISMSSADGKPHEGIVVTLLSPIDDLDVFESDADD